MDWGNAQFRGCGMVVDWLRDRWSYASLVALDAEPATPEGLLEVFQASREANTPVFGPHSIYSECVIRHLGSLSRGGLIEAGPRQGRRREYHATALGSALLASLGLAGEFGVARYDWLVFHCREARHVDTAQPLPSPSPNDSCAMQDERLHRRAIAMLFAVLLGPKWTYAVLAALTRGPLRFYRIAAVVNAAAAASADVVSGHLSDSILNARLDTLQHLGLVVRVPADIGRRTSYMLTKGGAALMEALEPVARFGIEHDAEMTAAVHAI